MSPNADIDCGNIENAPSDLGQPQPRVLLKSLQRSLRDQPNEGYGHDDRGRLQGHNESTQMLRRNLEQTGKPCREEPEEKARDNSGQARDQSDDRELFACNAPIAN